MFTDNFCSIVAILILLNEVLINPIFHRCIPSINLHWKITFGIVLQVGRYIVLVTLVTLSRQHYIMTDELSGNSTHPCMFQDSFINLDITPYDYRYFALPGLIASISYVLILVGAIEFLCSQVPYSMKGVVVGLFYFSYVSTFLLNRGIIKIFRITSPKWNSETLFSCGFWYLQTKSIFISIIILSMFLLSITYKKRKREDVLPNEQIFAERYYSKKLQCP